VDHEKQFALQTSEWVFSYVLVNSKLVEPGSLSTWQDLLKPQWKAKIAFFDPRGSGAGEEVASYLLVKFGGRPVNRALDARHNQIKADLVSAAEARAAAQARFEQQEKRLAALEHEIGAIAASIKQEAEAEKARLIAAAEDRARRIQEESAFLIEQQVKQAEEDLRREVAAAAVALAEKIVRSQLGASDQQRLIDTFVGDVASGNGHHTGTPAGGSPAPAGRGAPRSEI